MQTTRFAQYLESQYLETEVAGADPVKLIHMLYRGAVEAVGAARKHLAAGQIGPRSRQIQRAWDILQELIHSLDREQGGSLANRLAALYVYMQQRLIEANAKQADAPLAEVESLLSTLETAWRGILPATAPAAAITSKPHQPISCSY